MGVYTELFTGSKQLKEERKIKKQIEDKLNKNLNADIGSAKLDSENLDDQAATEQITRKQGMAAYLMRGKE